MTCTHRWRIEEPNGQPYVSGSCRHCGAERHNFPTSEAALDEVWKLGEERKHRRTYVRHLTLDGSPVNRELRAWDKDSLLLGRKKRMTR